MIYGLVLIIISLIGLYFGVVKKSVPLIVASIILFLFVIAVGIFFYLNPY